MKGKVGRSKMKKFKFNKKDFCYIVNKLEDRKHIILKLNITKTLSINEYLIKKKI